MDRFEAEAPASLAIRLFGPFDVRLRGQPVPPLRTRKGEWLLAVLTLRHGREVERAWLAGTFWPDSSESRALFYLRRELSCLRQALGPEASRLRSSVHTLCLDLTGAAVDLLAFDVASACGDSDSLTKAISLYRGPLLEGCNEEWVFPERELRFQTYLNALESVSARALGRAEHAAAIYFLRLAVAADPYRESAHRGLMQALAAGHEYAAATLVYRELRLLLHRELNAEPAPETTALFQQIQTRVKRDGATRRDGATGRRGDGATGRTGAFPRPVSPSPPLPLSVAGHPASRGR